MKNQNQPTQVIAKPAKHSKTRTIIIFEIIVYVLVVAFWTHFIMHL